MAQLLPLGATREQLHNAKRAIFSQCMVQARPGLNISYQKGIEEHVAQGKEHHRRVHYPTKREGNWRYFTVHAGQRAAKTLIGAMEGLFAMALPGTRGWITAPNYELTDRCFDYLWEFLVRQQVFGPGSIVKKSRTRDNRYIETAWGSWVKGKSAEAEDSLVGEQLDWEVNDEFGRVGESIWLENLEPRLVNRKGWAIFSGTPRGRGWFEKYSKRHADPELYAQGWRDLCFHTVDNIYIDKEWVLLKKKTTPRLVWAQEYEGQFVAFSGLVFADYQDRLYDPEAPGRGGHLLDPEGWLPEGFDRAIWVRGIDIGTRNPTACLWHAILPNHDVVLGKEYQEIHPSHDRHAQNISARSSMPVAWSVISHEAARKDQSARSHGISALDIYRQHGIFARQASTDCSAQRSSVNAYMAATLQDNPLHPRLWVMQGLKKTREAFMDYVFEERKSMRDIDLPEKPRKLNDHLCNATEFVLGQQPRYEPRWLERAQSQPMTFQEELRRDGLQGSTYAYRQAQRHQRRRGLGAAGRRMVN